MNSNITCPPKKVQSLNAMRKMFHKNINMQSSDFYPGQEKQKEFVIFPSHSMCPAAKSGVIRQSVPLLSQNFTCHFTLHFPFICKRCCHSHLIQREAEGGRKEGKTAERREEEVRWAKHCHFIFAKGKTPLV